MTKELKVWIILMQEGHCHTNRKKSKPGAHVLNTPDTHVNDTDRLTDKNRPHLGSGHGSHIASASLLVAGEAP